MLALNFNSNSAIGDTSTKTTDISKNNYSVTCSSCPTFVSSGKFNGAYNFTSLQYFIGPNTSMGTNSFTASVWITRRNNTYNEYVFSNQGGNAYHSGFYLISDVATTSNTMYFGLTQNIRGSPTSSKCYIANVDTNWHKLTAVYNYGHNISCYLDGVFANSSSISTFDSMVSNENISIGSRLPDTARGWDGLIDNLFIYTRPLTATEIKILYLSEFQKKDTSEYIFYANVTNLAMGTYTYYAWANDTISNMGQTDIRYVGYR